MKKVLLTLSAIYAALLMTGCDKGGGGGGTNVVQVPVCANGQTWNGTQCVTGLNTGTSTTFRYKTQSASRGDTGAIKSFLEYGLDVCRDKNSSGYYDCGNWAANNFQVSIAGNINTANNCYSATKQVTPASLTMNIAIQPPLNMYINYGFYYGTQPSYVRNGANITATGNNISNCNSVRIIGRYGLFDVTLDIENTNLNASTVNYKLWWGFSSTSSSVPSINPPRVISYGTLVRY